MPLASVTSVKCSVRDPVGADREIVAKQPSLERQRSLRLRLRLRQRRVCAEHPALHDEDVEVAVVVVIEQRDARRHDLGVVELRRTCR